VKVLAVSNQKGGVGKTTTAVTLAEGLCRLPHPRSVLLVDLDPQGQCAHALGLEPGRNVYHWLADGASLAEVMLPTRQIGLDLIPGGKRTAALASVLAAEGNSVLSVLAKALKGRLAGKYDVVVLDTPPGVGGLQEAALFAADYVLIPTACDVASLEGVFEIVKTLKVINELGGQGRIIGVLPTFFDCTNESLANLSTLQTSALGGLVLTPIRRRVAFREAWAMGRTIWAHDPTGDGAKDYAELVHKVAEVAR